MTLVASETAALYSKSLRPGILASGESFAEAIGPEKESNF
jgi:hypothetical protein